MGKWVYILAVVIIVVTLATAGIADEVLYLFGGEKATISAWLRDNWLWFAVPATVAVVLLFVLSMHLYLYMRTDDFETWLGAK